MASSGALTQYEVCSSHVSDSTSWSSSQFGDSFREVYYSTFRARYATSGVSPIISSTRRNFNGERVLQWETAGGGVICLKEIWLGHNLDDNAVCLRFGDSTGFPLAVFVDSQPSPNAEISVAVCFLLPGGTLHRIKLAATSESSSVLAALVGLRKGALVDISAEPSLRGSRSTYLAKMVPETCSIKCASWLNSDAVLLGLTQGSVLRVSFGSGDGVETFVVDKTSGRAMLGALQPLAQWFQPTAASSSTSDQESDVLAIACCTHGIVVLDTLGALRLYDSRTLALKGQFNAVHGVSNLHHQEQLFIENAKLAVVKDSDGRVAVAVAMLCSSGGSSIWCLCAYSFTSSSPLSLLGSVSPLSTELGRMLLDMQFSPTPSRDIDGLYCLYTLWRGDLGNLPILISTRFQASASHSHDGTVTLVQDSQRVYSSKDMLMEIPSSLMPYSLPQEPGHDAETDTRVWIAHAMQELFRPGRFSTRSIVECLIRDVPFEFQCSPDTAPRADDLPAIVDFVMDVCTRWASRVGDLRLPYAELLMFVQRRTLADVECGGCGLLAVRESMSCATAGMMALRDRLTVVGESLASGASNAVSGADLERTVKSRLTESAHAERLNLLRSSIKGYYQRCQVVERDLLQAITSEISDIAGEVYSSLGSILGMAPGDIQAAIHRVTLSCFDFEMGLMDIARLTSQQGGLVYSTQETHFLVADISRAAISNALEEALVSAVALIVLQRMTQAVHSLSTPAQQHMLHNSFQQAVHNIAYCSLLQWLDGIRPADDSALRKTAEIAFPLNDSLRTAKRSIDYGLVHGEKFNGSLLAHFWKEGDLSLPCFNGMCAAEEEMDDVTTFSSDCSWMRASARRCLFTLRPSAVGDLCRHLFKHGQYACLCRVASLLSHRLRDVELSSTVIGIPITLSPLVSVGRLFLVSRTEAMVGMAMLYECLRKHAQMRQMTPAGDMAMSAPLQARCEQALNIVLQSAPQNRIQDDTLRDLEARLGFQGHGGCLKQELDCVLPLDPSSACNNALALDALLCARETIFTAVDISAPLAVLLQSVERIDSMLICHPLFTNTCRDAYFASVLDVSRRVKVVMPSAIGGYLCRVSGESQLESLQARRAYCFADAPGTGLVQAMQTVMNETLLVSLGKVFNVALEDTAIEDAWTVLCQMLELEEGFKMAKHGLPDISQSSLATLTTLPQWRICLRSFVAHTCDTGHAARLCSLPDLPLLATGGSNIWLADEVVKELERLAKSSGLRASQPVSYYECLYTFLLSRGDFLEAAHCMLGYAFRDDNGSPASRARALAVVMSTLGCAQIPSHQQYLTIARRTNDSSVSSVFIGKHHLAVLFLLQKAQLATEDCVPSYSSGPGLGLWSNSPAGSELGRVQGLLQECAQAALALTTTQILSNLRLALDLGMAGEAYHASVDESIDGPKGSLSNRSVHVSFAMEIAIEGLTHWCIRSSPALDSTNQPSLSTPQDGIQCDDASFAFTASSVSIRRSPREVLWQDGIPQRERILFLLDTLARLDTAKRGWALIKIALDTVLAIERHGGLDQDALLGSTVLRQELVRISCGSMCSGLFSDTSSAASSNATRSFHSELQADPAALLRRLVANGRLDDACKVATEVLSALVYQKSVWVPYNVLDEVLAASRSSGQPEVRASLLALETALERHFEQMLVWS